MCKHRPSTSGLGQPRHTNSELWQPHGRSASKADDARSLRKLVGHADHPHQPRRMTMDNQGQTNPSKPRVEPWNKGKLIGQKPPLRPKHVWSIRTRLQMEGRTRDLAMFNLAIDSKPSCQPLGPMSSKDSCWNPGTSPPHQPFKTRDRPSSSAAGLRRRDRVRQPAHAAADRDNKAADRRNRA